MRELVQDVIDRVFSNRPDKEEYIKELNALNAKYPTNTKEVNGIRMPADANVSRHVTARV